MMVFMIQNLVKVVHQCKIIFISFYYNNISKVYFNFSAIDLITNLLQVKQRKRFTVDKSLVHVWLQVNVLLFFFNL